MSAGRWILEVTYPTLNNGAKEGYQWGSLDAPVADAVGRIDSGRGTDMGTGVRDLIFNFRTESGARNARARVLRLRKKGMRTQVFRR